MPVIHPALEVGLLINYFETKRRYINLNFGQAYYVFDIIAVGYVYM